MKEKMVARCPKCNRIIGVYVPRGGDGSAVRVYKHSAPRVLPSLPSPCNGDYELISLSKVFMDKVSP